MPWEHRGQKKYFYRTERVRGRAVRRYIGTGQAGELAAATDGLRRLEREIDARERRAEQARHQVAEAPLLGLCDVTDILTRVVLVAAGYRQHDRGAWRRCREPNPND